MRPREQLSEAGRPNARALPQLGRRGADVPAERETPIFKVYVYLYYELSFVSYLYHRYTYRGHM